ncbi:hypothetical protein Hypma_014899 [Hypsizygus marmoreus]|uniref:Uncharacterized protein n=1 Tax=Hypsizygus marmoreus TaxID=39966 RepID=A0A369K475_HYPMA|nr:hypothetical protein Hypma_014899 [Hypsizygus marmoreus]
MVNPTFCLLRVTFEVDHYPKYDILSDLKPFMADGLVIHLKYPSLPIPDVDVYHRQDEFESKPQMNLNDDLLHVPDISDHW